MPLNPPPMTAMRMSRRNAQALGSLHVIVRWSFDDLVGRRYRQSGGSYVRQLGADGEDWFFVSSSHEYVPQKLGHHVSVFTPRQAWLAFPSNPEAVAQHRFR